MPRGRTSSRRRSGRASRASNTASICGRSWPRRICRSSSVGCELLEQQQPDHPGLPGLREKFAALQDQVASSLTRAAGDVATGAGDAQIPTAPEAFDKGLEQVGSLQKQAESAFLMGQAAEAAEVLEQAEREMAALEQRYGGEIPKGHATLIVTQEKLAALKDQLAVAGSAD